MRNAIRTALKTSNPTLGVHPLSATSSSTPKPYVVVKLGEEHQAGISVGFVQSIYLWLYVDAGDLDALDALKAAVLSTLHGVELTTLSGITFELTFRGTIGDEFFDNDWKAMALGLNFQSSLIHEGRN